MAEVRFSKVVDSGVPKIRNVPIAVTPEGFWCCPSPVMFQKTLKAQSPVTKQKPTNSPPPSKPPSVHKKQMSSSPPKPKSDTSEEQKASNVENHSSNGHVAAERVVNRNKGESLSRKVSIEFGEPGTSDLKLVLLGKHGFLVKLIVHRDVLVEKSTFFAQKLCSEDPPLASLHIDDCEDVEGYVETVGLMYSKDMKLRLIKQSVQRVLQILKVAETIGFSSCIQSCLNYLEAVPWVGEEEEEKVVSSVLGLKNTRIGITVTPVLKRVSSNSSKPHKDTFSHILDLVLKSTDERSRREMKSVVLNLLKENNNNNNKSSFSSSDCSPPDICYESIYKSCKTSLNSLLMLFREASEPGFNDSVTKQIALEADNLSWLLEILADRRGADDYAVMWAQQDELASLHAKLPMMTRFHVSCVTARLFVGIGKGELLPCKDVRLALLKKWLEPLMGDYNWLQHGCRSFDRKAVEEGIGRTILTLPLEDQQRILLSWLGSFLKSGDKCPNLQRAFEVWWRRTFIKPHTEQRGNHSLSDHLMMTEDGNTNSMVNVEIETEGGNSNPSQVAEAGESQVALGAVVAMTSLAVVAIASLAVAESSASAAEVAASAVVGPLEGVGEMESHKDSAFHQTVDVGNSGLLHLEATDMKTEHPGFDLARFVGELKQSDRDWLMAWGPVAYGKLDRRPVFAYYPPVPAFFAASAANVDKTELMIICEELEAVSLSTTSAAKVLDTLPPFAATLSEGALRGVM
ncbi:LOW QUALITY PROTEIN: hypothetical protein V2J09_021690 [Rumex salicifolius]